MPLLQVTVAPDHRGGGRITLPDPKTLHDAGFRDAIAGSSPNREFCTDRSYSEGYSAGRLQWRRENPYQLRAVSNPPDMQPLPYYFCTDGADEIHSLMPT